MPESIDKLSIDITASASAATENIGKLRTELAGLKDAVQGNLPTKLKKLSEALTTIKGTALKGTIIPKSFTDRLNEMASIDVSKIASSLRTLSKAMSSFADFKPIPKEAIDQLGEITQKLSALANVSPEAISRATKVSVGVKSYTLKSATEAAASPVSPAESGTTRQQSREFTDVANSAKSASQAAREYNRAVREARSQEQSILRTKRAYDKVASSAKSAGQSFKKWFQTSAIAAPLRKAGDSVKQFGQKVKSLGEAFKRIMLYRAIRSIVKAIGTGIREGVSNLYQWSKAFGGEFAGSMDAASSSLLYFKNSVGAMAAPLVNAIVPALQAIVRAAVSAVEAINRLFAVITGAGYWTRAIEYPTEFAEAVGGAGGAAKELQKYLAPFDELNLLPDDNKGGGGGGASALDFSKMFERAELIPTEFEAKLRSAIENADWRGLGGIVGEKLNEVIGEFDSEGLGKKVGGYLSTAFQTAAGFIDKTDFTALGEEVAGFLNGVLSDTDWSALGETIGGAIGGLAQSVVGFINETDWGLVGTTISGFIIGGLGSLQDKLAGIDWATFGHEVISGVTSFITETDWGGMLNSWFSAFGTAVGGVSAFVIGGLAQAWEDIKTWFSNFKSQYIDPFTDENGQLTFEGFLTGILTAVKDIGTWLYDNVVKPFVDGFKEGFGISGDGNSSEMDSVGQQTINGFVSGITTAWEAVKNFFTVTVPESFDLMVTEAYIKVNSFKAKVKKAFNEIKTNVENTVNTFKENVVNKYNEIRNGIIEKVQFIQTRVTGIFATIRTTVENTVNGFKENVVNTFNDARNGVIEKVQFINTRVTALFNGITDFFTNTFQKNWETAIGKIAGFLDDHLIGPIRDGIEEVKRLFDEMKAKFESKINLSSISLPHFRLTPPNWKASDLLLKGSVPNLSISWYARGGIVDSPTLFGAGEAGKEAIVPLERNTQWVDMVANELNRRSAIGNDTTDAVEDAGDSIVNALMTATAQIIRAMENNKTGPGDFDAFVRQVTRTQNRQARSMGY